MDVIFLYSNEDNWEKNLLNLRLVVGHNSAIIPVDAKGCNKHEAFKKVANTFDDPNHRFILVEGDNWVFPEFVELLHIEQNGKVFALSPYGFKSCHGGIKILTPAILMNSLELAKTEHDLSVHMNLSVISDKAFSRHSFDETALKEFMVAAKEIIKLYFWGNKELLASWQSTKECKRIYDAVIANIRRFNLLVLIDQQRFNDTLTEIFYFEYFKVAVLGIMKNESNYIQNYIDSFSRFDQIFLLDTGSSDNSVAIARANENVEVFEQEFPEVHYGDFRSALLDKLDDRLTDFDFIFWVDIDETPIYEECGAFELFKTLAETPKELCAFEITRRDISGSPPFRLQRIFRTTNRGYWIYQIHEQHRFKDNEVWGRPIVVSPFQLLHLESEKIQTLEKKKRYKQLITKNFLDAEQSNDQAAIFHYLFFYIDILANECETEKLLECYEKHIKNGKLFEFPEWYLRRYMFYFGLMRRDDLVEELLSKVKEQSEQHYQTLITSKAAIDAIDKNSSFDVIVDKSNFIAYDNTRISIPATLVAKIEGPSINTQSVKDELRNYFDNMLKFMRLNDAAPDFAEEIIGTSSFEMRFTFNNHLEFYKFYGSRPCLFNFFRLTEICIANNLKKQIYGEK